MKTPEAFDELIAQLESGAQCRNCPHQRLLSLLRDLRSELYPSNGRAVRRNGNGNGHARPQPEPQFEPECMPDGTASEPEDCGPISDILDEIEQATVALKKNHIDLEQRRIA